MILPLALLSLEQPSEFGRWGTEALSMIRRDYYLSETKLYAERPDKKAPAFNWDVGVMLSALNAAAKFDSKYKPWLREFADSSRVYWNKGGYDVLPTPKPLDRYYDDNAWMSLALVETFEVLGDPKYLKWAEGALDFALKGLSPAGGVFWRESDHASRNTCSNAPTAMACLAVYRHTKDTERISQATAIVEWTRGHLEDSVDHLYWDNLHNNGKVDKTKWTYNTALMIRSMNALGHDTKDMVSASKSRWLKDGGIADPGRFAHLLLEAWIEVDGLQPDFLKTVRQVAEARSKKGHYPVDWNKSKVPSNPELLDQAAFARACLFIANKQRSG